MTCTTSDSSVYSGCVCQPAARGPPDARRHREGETMEIIRVGLYVYREDYRQLKALLARRGRTVSEWLREQIARTIAEQHPLGEHTRH